MLVAAVTASAVGGHAEPLGGKHWRRVQQVEQVVDSAVQHAVDELAEGHEPAVQVAGTRPVPIREWAEEGDEATGTQVQLEEELLRSQCAGGSRRRDPNPVDDRVDLAAGFR